MNSISSVIEQDLMVDPDGERLGIRLRVVDRDVDGHVAEIGAAIPLRDLAFLGHRAAEDIEPHVVAEADRLDDERVAFPVPDRVAVPPGLQIVVELRQRPAVQ